MKKIPYLIYHIQISPDLNIEYISSSVNDILGYSADDFYENSNLLFKVIHEDDRQIVKQMLNSSLTSVSLVFRLITKDNDIIWIEQKGTLIYDKQDNLRAIEGIVRNITERANAMEEIRKLSQAIEQSPSTVAITDTDGNLEYVNPKFTALTGYSADEVIGENPRILKSGHQSAQVYEELWEAISSGEEWHGEFHNEKKNGEFYWESASISAIKDSKGKITHYLKVAEDITRRKEAEKKLASYTAELQVKSWQLEKAYNKINDDLEKARQIHEQFLPTSFPEIEGLSFAGYYQPAEHLGGDFYNFVQIDNYLLVYLVDVTGHGLEGALLNIFIRESISSFLLSHYQTEDELSPSEILEFISQKYRQENFPEDYFICLLLVVFDLEEGLINYSNAGFQNPPLVIDKDGDFILALQGGLPISATLDQSLLCFQEQSLELEAGSSLFLTTDGLIEETINKEMYGEGRVKKILKENYCLEPKMVIEKIKKSFKDFSGSLQGSDDITFLMIQK